jgi:hypothetical protein
MKKKSVLFSAVLLVLSAACDNHKPGTGDAHAGIVSAKANLYVNGLLPEPIVPPIGSPFSVTVSVVNEGTTSSGEYDLWVSLQRRGDGSMTFGSEKFRMSNQDPGATAQVKTGKVYFFKDAGDYEFIIDTLVSGIATTKHWLIQAK